MRPLSGPNLLVSRSLREMGLCFYVSMFVSCAPCVCFAHPCLARPGGLFMHVCVLVSTSRVCLFRSILCLHWLRVRRFCVSFVLVCVCVCVCLLQDGARFFLCLFRFSVWCLCVAPCFVRICMHACASMHLRLHLRLLLCSAHEDFRLSVRCVCLCVWCFGAHFLFVCICDCLLRTASSCVASCLFVSLVCLVLWHCAHFVQICN